MSTYHNSSPSSVIYAYNKRFDYDHMTREYFAHGDDKLYMLVINTDGTYKIRYAERKFFDSGQLRLDDRIIIDEKRREEIIAKNETRDVSTKCGLCYDDKWNNPYAIGTSSGVRIYCKTCIQDWTKICKTDPYSNQPIVFGPIRYDSC